MAKKEENKQGNSEENLSGAPISTSGENGLPSGSEGNGGEEKGGESVEKPPESSPAPESLKESAKATETKEKAKAKVEDFRRLKISALVSGQLFAPGTKASDIPKEALALIDSKYFEEIK